MSWSSVAWKVFIHGGLRDPRKEGGGCDWRRYTGPLCTCTLLCVCVFDSVCVWEAKRNLAKTLNMDEKASVPHQPNVPAATWFNSRNKQTDACTRTKKYTQKHNTRRVLSVCVCGSNGTLNWLLSLVAMMPPLLSLGGTNTSFGSTHALMWKQHYSLQPWRNTLPTETNASSLLDAVFVLGGFGEESICKK